MLPGRKEGMKEPANQSHASRESAQKQKLDFQAGSNKREAEFQAIIILEQDLRKPAHCHLAQLL